MDLQWSQRASMDDVPSSLQLRVLVVDSDVSSHYSLSNMINSCGFSCGMCFCAMDALLVLRDKDRKKPDVIMIAAELSDMSGLELLEIVRKEMVDFPVIMMMPLGSNLSQYNEATKLGCHGCIFKPVHDQKVLREKLQHVVHTKFAPPSNIGGNYGGSGGIEDMRKETALEDGSNSSPNHHKKVYFSADGLGNPTKKDRLIWTEDLNKAFLAVLNEIGLEKATPNKILEAMHDLNYKDLTRDHISSRLQKYRGKKRALDGSDISADSRDKNGVSGVGEAGNPVKKTRLVWTVDLKQSFEDYVNEIGLQNAAPSKILKAMEALGYKGLTREHIASHLQKYKISVERASASTGFVLNDDGFSVDDEGNQVKMAQCSSSVDLETSFEDYVHKITGSYTSSASNNNQTIVQQAHYCDIATTEKGPASIADGMQIMKQISDIPLRAMAASSITSQAIVPYTANNSEVDDNIYSDAVDEAHDFRLLGNEDIHSSDTDVSYYLEGSRFSTVNEAQGYDQRVENKDGDGSYYLEGSRLSTVNETQGYDQRVENKEDDDCSGIATSIDAELSCLSRVDEAQDSREVGSIDSDASGITEAHNYCEGNEASETAQDPEAAPVEIAEPIFSESDMQELLWRSEGKDNVIPEAEDEDSVIPEVEENVIQAWMSFKFFDEVGVLLHQSKLCACDGSGPRCSSDEEKLLTRVVPLSAISTQLNSAAPGFK